MLRSGWKVSFVLAALAALGNASAAPAADRLPFAGILTGDYTITPVPGAPPTLVDVLVTAEGLATHLGRFRLTIPHRVDRSQTPPSAVGTYRFTAANGDTLSATMTGQSSPTDYPGILHLVERATITGGTGRFANATGSFVCERWIDTAELCTIGFFDGSISLRRPGRP